MMAALSAMFVSKLVLVLQAQQPVLDSILCLHTVCAPFLRDHVPLI